MGDPTALLITAVTTTPQCLSVSKSCPCHSSALVSMGRAAAALGSSTGTPKLSPAVLSPFRHDPAPPTVQRGTAGGSRAAAAVIRLQRERRPRPRPAPSRRAPPAAAADWPCRPLATPRRRRLAARGGGGARRPERGGGAGRAESAAPWRRRAAAAGSPGRCRCCCRCCSAPPPSRVSRARTGRDGTGRGRGGRAGGAAWTPHPVLRHCRPRLQRPGRTVPPVPGGIGAAAGRAARCGAGRGGGAAPGTVGRVRARFPRCRRQPPRARRGGGSVGWMCRRAPGSGTGRAGAARGLGGSRSEGTRASRYRCRQRRGEQRAAAAPAARAAPPLPGGSGAAGARPDCGGSGGSAAPPSPRTGSSPRVCVSRGLPRRAAPPVRVTPLPPPGVPARRRYPVSRTPEETQVARQGSLLLAGCGSIAKL